MSKGYVYILSNPSMPGLVKIGKTTRTVQGRANELFQTGVPAEFKVEAEILCPDCDEIERDVHLALAEQRVSNSREFFAVSVETAEAAIKDCHIVQVEEWLNEFIPDSGIYSVYEPFIDPSDIGLLAHRISEEFPETDYHYMEVADAFGSVTPSEILPALKRRDERVAARKEKLIKEGKLHVVGEQ